MDVILAWISSSLVKMSWLYTVSSHLQLGTTVGSGGSWNLTGNIPGRLRKSTHWVVYRAKRWSHSSLWFSRSCFITRVGLLPKLRSRSSRMTRISQAYLRKRKTHTFIYFTYLICKLLAYVFDKGLTTGCRMKVHLLPCQDDPKL